MKTPKRLFFGLDIDDPKTESKILVFVVKVWSGSAILISLILWFDFPKQGVFGDMFGAVNALFSGLAFAGIIYTILLQREELRAQRKELSLNRKELRGQKREFKTQNVTLKRQRFEATFFNMLSIHYRIIELIQYKNQHGIRAFVQLNKDFESIFNNAVARKRSYALPPDKIKEGFDGEYDRLSKLLLPYFSSYIQSIIQLHKTIKQSRFKPDVEARYLQTLKSYLSVAERVFLYYYTHRTEDADLAALERDLEILDDEMIDEQIAILKEQTW